MIIPREAHPEKSLYIVGAEVMSILKEENFSSFDVCALYDKFSNYGKNRMSVSFSYFVLALIWLNFLGLVDINQEGCLMKCF